MRQTETIVWSARSPDLSPLDSSGVISSSLVYIPQPLNFEEHRQSLNNGYTIVWFIIGSTLSDKI